MRSTEVSSRSRPACIVAEGVGTGPLHRQPPLGVGYGEYPATIILGAPRALVDYVAWAVELLI